MKYISLLQISESLRLIGSINQFFGFTFLAAKKARLPIGSTVHLSLDSVTKKHFNEYYRLDPRSKYYFRIFRFNNSDQVWLKPEYPQGKGLQKLNTTTFKDAFIHEKGSRDWGWAPNYVEFLKTLLPHGQPIQTFHLACWFFRSRAFKDDATRNDVVNAFYNEFNATDKEKQLLFTDEYTSTLTERDAFQETPVMWEEIIKNVDPAPDVDPANGGILSLLEMEGIGPVSPLIFEPAQRLNIITGDNGLGKTFILETAWWALTGNWAGRPAYPNRNMLVNATPKIKFLISGKGEGKPQTINYSRQENSWPKLLKRNTISGLVVYARVDGSFAIWDPAGKTESSENEIIVFDRDEIWNGNSRIEGLIRDWTKWQDKPEKYPFDIFQRVIAKMSPPEMGQLTIGAPVRVLGDPREIPTLTHSYGEVPILHESAGIKRIITLAYLIVWVWNEHKVLSEQYNRPLEKRMVILIDELEAHLHPRWQRAILPALLDVSKILNADLETQFIIASHSPLVLASSESIFNSDTDRLFHLDTNEIGDVSFKPLQYVRYGHVNSWLESHVFNLKQARSNDAEQVIAQAIEIQKKENPTKEEIISITANLLKNLSTEDKFWNRWIFFARKKGVEV